MTENDVTINREELRLIVDLASAARKIDDGSVAPMVGGTARSIEARRITDKYKRVLRQQH